MQYVAMRGKIQMSSAVAYLNNRHVTWAGTSVHSHTGTNPDKYVNSFHPWGIDVK